MAGWKFQAGEGCGSFGFMCAVVATVAYVWRSDFNEEIVELYLGTFY